MFGRPFRRGHRSTIAAINSLGRDASEIEAEDRWYADLVQARWASWRSRTRPEAAISKAVRLALAAGAITGIRQTTARIIRDADCLCRPTTEHRQSVALPASGSVSPSPPALQRDDRSSASALTGPASANKRPSNRSLLFPMVCLVAIMVGRAGFAVKAAPRRAGDSE